MRKQNPSSSSDETDRLSHAYLRVFDSPDGQTVLKDLESAYNGNLLVRNEPFTTHYNIGANSVYQYIVMMRNYALEKENHAEK